MSHHLKQVHKGIKKGSLEYKAALKEARPIKPWRSSARVSKTVDEAEKRLSNQSDSDSAARISVQEDSGEVSGEDGSESSGDTTDNCGYEGKSDSESQVKVEALALRKLAREFFVLSPAGCRQLMVEGSLRRYQSNMLHS